MGRTLPTFNLWLGQEIESWRPYRRALRREDQESFDRLFSFAKLHMAEAAQSSRLVPFDALVMSVLLEQQKEIQRLRNALTKTEAEARGSDE